jgi:predicted HTH domain antitoxin
MSLPMAATKTSRNDTPNTPGVSESKIAGMKVDELRRRLRGHGVKGTGELKKQELVKKLIKAETSGARKKNPAGRNDTPNTPDVNESKIARMKVDDLRNALRKRGVKGIADLKKADLVKKLIKAETSGRKSATKSATKPGRKAAKSDAGGGKRTGKNTAKSLQYAQEIRSTDDRPERAGRSLVTTDHEVIRRWAQARKAVPATVAGTEHEGHLGVLRFDFPGYTGDRLTEVSWDEWFEAFDKRRLNFIYQERQSSGKRSNFFQLENPDE